MSTLIEGAQMPKDAIKVTPKEMRWGIDQEPEIYIPNDLPHDKGVFEDIVTYVRANYPEIDSQRYWRMAIDGIPRRFFFTPHNNRVCWRDKACYDSLYIWDSRRKKNKNKKPTIMERIRRLLK